MLTIMGARGAVRESAPSGRPSGGIDMFALRRYGAWRPAAVDEGRPHDPLF